MLIDHLIAVATNLILAGIPVAVYLATQRFRHGVPWGDLARRLGLQKPEGMTLGALVVTLGALAFVTYRFLSTPITELVGPGSPLQPFVGAPITALSVACTFLYGVVQTGFCEELLFRGLVAGAIGRRTTLWKANLLQAIPFTAMHLPLLFFMPDAWLLIAIAPTVAGLAFGWIRLRTGSVWPAVAAHGLSNWFLALLVLGGGDVPISAG